MDASIGKGVIFCVAFLGIFALIVGAMPSEYFYVDDIPEYSARDTPSTTWSVEDVKTLLYKDNEYSNLTVYFYLDITRGALETVQIEGYWERLSGDFDQWRIRKYWYQWGWLKQTQEILPVIQRNSRSTPEWSPNWLSQDDVFHSSNLDEDGNFSRVDMKDDSFNYVLFMSFNQTSYANLEDAVDGGEVLIELAMGWEAESAGLSGGDIITRLLFFQPLPEIGDSLLTGILALPLWTALGFAVFVIIAMIVEMLPLT